MKIEILDSTLRDGAQGEGISFSVEDKLAVFRALRDFGIDYIEAGNPYSNPKDFEFFKLAGNERGYEKLCAFGSTRKKNITPDEDENVRALIAAKTKVISIFGKSWDLHAADILSVSLDENLAMISDTCRYLTSYGRQVFFDAEHFFDGYKNNAPYALETIKAAVKGGAARIVLCDTNGGCFPDEVRDIVKKVTAAIHVPVGIHCHNDTDCAVANSVAAVLAGAVQVQGTFIGIGERAGNANLSAVIPNLQLKRGYKAVPDLSGTVNGTAASLTETANFIAERANVHLSSGMPYVGVSAFAHKAGMHADGVAKSSASFEHIPPAAVGNTRHFPLSEVSGRSAILTKIANFETSETALSLDKNSPELTAIVEKLKQLEHAGYQFEAAEASFELLVLRECGKFVPKFDVEDFKIVTSLLNGGDVGDGGNMARATAVIKISAGGVSEITAAEGDGPVNALDIALRKALRLFYKEIDNMHLTDYKVRIINSAANTAATTRVLIESTDGRRVWTTVGVSKDIISASMQALSDSVEYFLRRC